MARETPRQKKTVARVMNEFKDGDLASGPGGRDGEVQDPRQALAIALHEASLSRPQSASADAEPSYNDLLKIARQRAIPGRSRMSKDQLIRALRRH